MTQLKPFSHQPEREKVKVCHGREPPACNFLDSCYYQVDDVASYVLDCIPCILTFFKTEHDAAHWGPAATSPAKSGSLPAPEKEEGEAVVETPIEKPASSRIRDDVTDALSPSPSPKRNRRRNAWATTWTHWTRRCCGEKPGSSSAI
ncbi:hypothetical protein GQ600_14184 [Phytophthora cactorum]|nr:hypothetical protein GQ600_14184 [Phytophthora cactorum]